MWDVVFVLGVGSAGLDDEWWEVVVGEGGSRSRWCRGLAVLIAPLVHEGVDVLDDLGTELGADEHLEASDASGAVLGDLDVDVLLGELACADLLDLAFALLLGLLEKQGMVVDVSNADGANEFALVLGVVDDEGACDVGRQGRDISGGVVVLEDEELCDSSCEAAVA